MTHVKHQVNVDVCIQVVAFRAMHPTLSQSLVRKMEKKKMKKKSNKKKRKKKRRSKRKKHPNNRREWCVGRAKYHQPSAMTDATHKVHCLFGAGEMLYPEGRRHSFSML
eukprot:m.358613 g.358613  ORF g.358613 m.358613 type:complete len:109 (+) comp18198_c0_seq1:103-429(+)